MKKSVLYVGITYFAVVLIMILYVVVVKPDAILLTRLSGLIGGMIGAGAALIIRYFYTNSPKNKVKYEQKAAEQNISLKDERKIGLRDRAGRYMYAANLAVFLAAGVIITVLNAFGVTNIQNNIVVFIFLFIIINYVAGIFVFRYLDKRY